MSIYEPADQLHRLIKAALDSGAAESLQAAEEMFRGYRLVVDIGERGHGSPNHQAALLTTVNLARRVFLGGVTVIGDLTAPVLLPGPHGRTLEEAVLGLGGQPGKPLLDTTPRVVIGGGVTPRAAGFVMRTIWRGWSGGAAPAHAALCINDETAMPLAPMTAAALAVAEAFFHVRGGDAGAGRRLSALSLWAPAQAEPFSSEADQGPTLERLPNALWLVGLGHLGQAYLWALSLLPYPEPAAMHLVLQDMDRVTPSSESTSVLTAPADLGRPKTRVVADWAEARGFSTHIVERFFDDGFHRRADEPSVVLCGVDNALARRALEKVGFDLIVEAGLGRGAGDFQRIRLHTLPGVTTADELWPLSAGAVEDVTGQPAYAKLLQEGQLDRCGVTLLADKAVGAPFVGAVAATLVIAELLRLLHGGQLHQVIDLDLTAVGQQAAISQDPQPPSCNPGFVSLD